MARFWLALPLLLALAGTAGAAKRKKKKNRAKTKAKTEQITEVKKAKETEKVKEESPEKKPDTVSTTATNAEMEVYRAIQNREQSTVQDLADLTLMYRGEFSKLATAEKRLARARELRIIQGQKAGDILERGTLAYAIMKLYQPESGLLFWLTGWERYALRDVQEAGIMPAKATVSQHISGEQLMGTITAAEEYRDGQKKWGAEK